MSVILLAGCAAPVPVDAPTATSPEAATVDWDNREVYRANLTPAEQAVLDDLPGASVYHIQVRLADDLGSLEGSQQLRYTNREDIPLDEIHFQLFPNLAGGKSEISSALVDGKRADFRVSTDGATAILALEAALEPGGQTVIELKFSVSIPDQIGGNYGLFGYFNEILVLDGFYPAVPAYDQRGWNSGALPPNSDSTHQDASFYLVTVDAPEKLVLVASGSEVERGTDNGRQQVTFAAGPARDFYLAASEKFIKVSQQRGDTLVNSYAMSGREEAAREAMETATASLEIFNTIIGPYPYSEFDVVSTPMQGAIGIEYPGMTGINMLVYDPQGELSGRKASDFMEMTVAHEVGHQWFYNAVGNDQINEPWVDEALVQYITGLYYKERYGAEGYQGARASWLGRWQRTGNAEIPIGKPAGEYEGREYGAIVYGRGPLFFEALNKEMGDEAFARFLQTYYAAQKWEIASGAELQETAEASCACELDALFDVWVTP